MSLTITISHTQFLVGYLAKFDLKHSSLVEVVEADVGHNYSTSGSAAKRGVLGPFGLIVLTDENLFELTYFFHLHCKGC